MHAAVQESCWGVLERVKQLPAVMCERDTMQHTTPAGHSLAEVNTAAVSAMAPAVLRLRPRPHLQGQQHSRCAAMSRGWQ